MLKFIAGIVVGSCVVAAAEFKIDVTNSPLAAPPAALLAGALPDGNAGLIRLDADGYVICSPKGRP